MAALGSLKSSQLPKLSQRNSISFRVFAQKEYFLSLFPDLWGFSQRSLPLCHRPGTVDTSVLGGFSKVAANSKLPADNAGCLEKQIA